MYLVDRWVFALDGAEGVQANVEGHESEFDSLCLKRGHQVLGEVQSRGGCGDAAGLPGIHGLVPFRVFETLVDVGRQGRLPQRADALLGAEADGLDAAGARVQHLHLQGWLKGRLFGSDNDLGSRPEAASRLSQGLPDSGAFSSQEEQFHLAAGVLPAAVEAGRYDPALVEHHHVAGLDVPSDVQELPVLDAAGGAVKDQQPGGVPGFYGGLGDEFRGQAVVEIAGAHFGEAVSYRRSARVGRGWVRAAWGLGRSVGSNDFGVEGILDSSSQAPRDDRVGAPRYERGTGFGE